MGGGALFRTLLDARLVDTVELSVMPVLLGSGVPLLLPAPARNSGWNTAAPCPTA